MSTQGQDDRDTPEKQRQYIRETLKRLGVPDVPERVTWVELPGVSGSDVVRTPEWSTIIVPTLTRDPDCHLVVDERKRLLRAKNVAEDFKAIGLLQTLGRTVYSTEGASDMSDPATVLVETIMGAIAGKEAAEIAREFWKGKETRRRNGEHTASDHALPKGITYEKTTKVWSYTHEIQIIRHVFRRFVEDREDNISLIGTEVGALPTTVAGWLANPIYRGERIIDTWHRGKFHQRNGRQGWREKVKRPPDQVIKVRVFGGPAQESQLIDDHTWDEAQRRLEARKKGHKAIKRSHAPTIPFSGLTFSGYEDVDGIRSPGRHFFGFTDEKREHVLYGIAARGKLPARYACRCAITMGKGVGPAARCDLRYFRAEDFNKAVDAAMVRICESNEFKDHVLRSLDKDTSSIRQELDGTREELQKVDKKIERLLDLYEVGSIDKDRYVARQVQHNENAERLRRRIRSLESQQVPRVADVETALNAMHYPSGGSPTEKREFIRRYAIQVIVKNKGIRLASVRLPGDPKRGVPPVYPGGLVWTWKDLVGYDITDQVDRAAGRGLHTAGRVAELIGIKPDRLRYLIRTDRLPQGSQKKGLWFLWTDEDLEATKAAYGEMIESSTSIPTGQ